MDIIGMKKFTITGKIHGRIVEIARLNSPFLGKAQVRPQQNEEQREALHGTPFKVKGQTHP
jgi:hypothetical protein